ncbi:hypothetical protein [Streptomyces sp. NPDC020996]|uniref:hypothetical protein n=1 Tax=Streptomyces sp. NPDC020996 TaxID=3154791 RepID=UPI0033C1E202
MEGFFDGLEQAIRERNWHAVLVMALTLPDICAKIVMPAERSGRRYAAWFDQHVKPKYTFQIGVGAQERVFLSGTDCYALRCVLLHEGSTDTARQPASDALDRFHFCVPGQFNLRLHCNQIGRALILMVDEFAVDVLNAARAWWSSLDSAEREATAGRLLAIRSTDNISF